MLTPTTTVNVDGTKFLPEPAPCGIVTVAPAAVVLLLDVLVVVELVVVVDVLVVVVELTVEDVVVMPVPLTVMVPFIHGW